MRLFKYYVLANSHSLTSEDQIPKAGALRLKEVAQVLKRGSLNILCASQPTNRSEGFPFWLPDFSKDNGMERCTYPLNDQYSIFVDAGSNFSRKDTLLEVLGVVVTTLEQGYVTDKDDDTEATDEPCLLTRVWKFMLLAESQDFSALETDAFWSALQLGRTSGRTPGQMVRTALRNAVYWKLGIKPTEKAFASSLFEALEYSIKNPSVAIVAFLENFRRGSLHRRFAMMRIGRELQPAMIPADARPGDSLCLLRGSDYPVLLRPVDDLYNNFEFVGPCCIPGWSVNKNASHYGPVKRIVLQ